MPNAAAPLSLAIVLPIIHAVYRAGKDGGSRIDSRAALGLRLAAEGRTALGAFDSDSSAGVREG